MRGTKPAKQIIAVAGIAYALLFMAWIIRGMSPVSADDYPSYQARSASSFIDSIGVNVHLGYPAYKNAYSSIIKPKLQALGVRHVREPLPHANDAMAQILSRYGELTSPSGGFPPINFSFISSSDPASTANPLNDCWLPNLKAIVQGGTIPCGPRNGQSVSSIKVSGVENINEPDHCPSYACGGASNPDPNSPFYWWTKSREQNPNWPDDVLASAQNLRTKLQSDGVTSSIAPLAPSFVWLPYYNNSVIYPDGGGTLYNYLQPLRSYVARGVAHPYCHLKSIEVCYTGQVAPYAAFFSGQSTAVTETGHSTADYTEKQQAKYTTSILFDFFARGVERTFLYELFDDVNAPTATIQNYGLINEDGREKTAYTWLKNAISLLNDSGGSPEMLDMNLGFPSGVKYVLLQKSDSSFWLAIQNDKSNRTDTDSTKPATIGFRTPKNISYYNLESTSAYQVDTNRSSISINIPDRIVLLQITTPPPSNPAPGVTPTPGVTYVPGTTATPGSGNGGNGSNGGNGDSGGNSGSGSNASGSTSNTASGQGGVKRGNSGAGGNKGNQAEEDGSGFSLGPITIKNGSTLDRALNATVLVGSVLGLIFIIVTLGVTRMRLGRRKSEYEDVEIES